MSSIGTDVYTLKLLDEITRPLKSIERSMSKVVETATKLEKMATGGLGLLKIAAGVGAAVVGFTTLKGVVSSVIGLLEKVASVAYSVGKGFVKLVMDATLFRTRSIAGFEVFQPGKGNSLFQSALRIGGITPASELEVVKQMNTLTSVGYRGRRREATNAALLDVQAVHGDENRQNLLYYYRKLMGGVGFKRGDVAEAAAQAGVKERDVLLRAIQLGGGKPVAGNDQALVKQIKAMRDAGKISGMTIVDALNSTIRTTVDGPNGKLGDTAKKFGMGSLAGLLSNLEDAPTRFLAQMKLENLPGIKAVMDFLKRLLTFFDHATPQGRALTRVVEQLINTLFGGLDRIGQAELQKFFEGALRVTEQLVRALGQAWELIGNMAKGGDIAGSSAKLISEIGKLFGKAVYEGLMLAWRGSKEGPKALPPSMTMPGPGRGVSTALALAAGRGGRTQHGPVRTDAEALRMLHDPTPGAVRPYGLGVVQYPAGAGAPSINDLFPKPPEVKMPPVRVPGMFGVADLNRPTPQLALPPLVTTGPPTLGAGPAGPSFSDIFGGAAAQGEEGARNLVRGFTGGINDEGEIRSPSRVTERQGRYMVEGFVRGVESRMREMETGGADPVLDRLAQVLFNAVLRTGAGPS